VAQVALPLILSRGRVANRSISGRASFLAAAGRPVFPEFFRDFGGVFNRRRKNRVAAYCLSLLGLSALLTGFSTCEYPKRNCSHAASSLAACENRGHCPAASCRVQPIRCGPVSGLRGADSDPALRVQFPSGPPPSPFHKERGTSRLGPFHKGHHLPTSDPFHQGLSGGSWLGPPSFLGHFWPVFADGEGSFAAGKDNLSYTLYVRGAPQVSVRHPYKKILRLVQRNPSEFGPFGPEISPNPGYTSAYPSFAGLPAI
jgi:hypothetical protein